MQAVDDLGDSILAWATEGWTPTVPLPKGVKTHVTEAWPMTSFRAAFSLLVAYGLFLVIGSYIQTRPGAKPISAKAIYPVSFVYNVVQIFLCAYMSVEALFLMYREGFTFFPYPKCNPFNAANPPIAKLLWLFYVSKILDFVDTVTIVLKQSWKQLSFLHYYHHATIFLFYWLNVNRGYDGEAVCFAGVGRSFFSYSHHTWKRSVSS